MTKAKEGAGARAEDVSEFEVLEGGTLRVAGFIDAETRADFYVYDFGPEWERSPADLAAAMDVCTPLAWEVQSLYGDARDELLGEIDEAEYDEEPDDKRIALLRERLAAMPVEPEEGGKAWLLPVDKEYFSSTVVERIRDWLASPPDWGSYEDDYLLDLGTGQGEGAAFAYFRSMDFNSLDTLGVVVVEGDHPGSTYYAAKLRCDIDEANKAAEAAGLPVRFVRPLGAE